MHAPSARGRCAVAILLLIALIADVRTAMAQSASPTRAPLGLGVSLPAAKRLAGARDFVAAGDWDAAIKSLDLLTGEFGESLIEVAPRHYVNVRLAAATTLVRLPPAGLAAYRRRVDPALASMYEEAVERRDVDLMRQIVSEGFASSVGDNALDWLAESALEAGEIENARRLWTAMLPPANPQPSSSTVLRYPDSDRTPAEICARLVLCSLLQGDRERARAELAIFQTKFGQATGALAGRQGPLEKTLAVLVDHAARWQSDAARGGSASFAMSVAVPAPELEGILWSQPLPALLTADGAELNCLPAIWNDAVLISTPTGVRALNIAAGMSRWPAGVDDKAGLDVSTQSVAERQPTTVGSRNFGGQVVDNRWYGRRGSLVSVPAVRAASIPPSELVCFDLASEGRLEWAVSSDELAELEGARFSGPPLVTDGRLYVAVRRAAPQVEIELACLDADDGKHRWVRPLCAALEPQPILRHRIHHDVLAAGGGLVFQCPGAGVIAARVADTGELSWAVTYGVRSTSPGSASEATALAYRGGRLFAKPGDTDQLMALNAADGRMLWSVRCPSRIREFLGIDAGRLIAAGDQLWGFDVAAGSSWRFGFDDPEGFGVGRGALAAGRAYWTSRNELFVVDTGSGQLVDRISLSGDTGLTGGNLALAGRRLLIASPTRLTALGPRPDE